MGSGPGPPQTTQGMSSEPSAQPLYSLCLVLVQTFSALGLGYLCIRAKFIDPSKGELGALRFYVAWIGLPLVVFDKLATACLGDIDWSVVLACSLAKLIIFASTFVMTFVAYKSQRSYGQRVLTATTFSFFAVASNDLAVGFPVIHAMYGPTMEVYISANVFVFQTFFQPMTMMLFELGIAWRGQEEEEGAQGGGIGLMPVLRKAGKGVMQNVVILATLAGLSYQLLLGKSGLLATLVEVVDGVGQFPHPMEDIVALWTAPFTFLFLFINGTSLTEASLGFWSSLLVLMKVVACSYISFFLGSAMLPADKSDLRNFTFFYGSIPSGGAPLVFAALFDPGCVGVVASASLYCLILAGPIEILTALFLGHNGLRMDEVLQAQQGMAVFSAGASGAVLLLILFSRRNPAAPSLVVSCYTAVVFAYDCVTVLMHRIESSCGRLVWERFFGLLQMLCFLLVLYMQFQLAEGRPAATSHLLALAGVALGLAVGLPYFNTLDDLCQDTPDASTLALSLLFACNLVLLLASCGLTIRGVVLKRRCRRHSSSLDGCVGVTRLAESMTPSSARMQVRRHTSSMSVAGDGLAMALVGLQAMRLLMEVLNLLIKIVSLQRSTAGFTPMFMLVNVLEHGQGVILLVVAIFHGLLGTLLEALLHSCCTFRPSPELPGSPDETTAEEVLGHSLEEPALRGCCMSLPVRRTSLDVPADPRLGPHPIS